MKLPAKVKGNKVYYDGLLVIETHTQVARQLREWLNTAFLQGYEKANLDAQERLEDYLKKTGKVAL